MLVLKRNMTETGIIPDDETMGAIMPWMWYWHDPERKLNFSLETVKAWKDQVSGKSLPLNAEMWKEYNAVMRGIAAEKRGLVKEVKEEYLETLFIQE